MDPDQVDSSETSLTKPADLVLYCFLKRINPCLLYAAAMMMAGALNVTPVRPYLHHT